MKQQLLLSLALCLPFALHAQDEEGCKDPSVLTRFPGCRIENCSAKEFDAAQFLIGRHADHTEKLRDVEGKTMHVFYVCPENVSALQITRNAEAALRKAGFRAAFQGRDQRNELAYTANLGPAWVGIRTSNDDLRYEVLFAEAQQMEQKVSASAEEWAGALADSGTVQVYGIEFATASAQLLPAAEPVLAQVKVLLDKDPALRLEISGHTDSDGTPARNLRLSQDRAASVKAWLVAQGVAASRLTTKGWGDTKPLADNSEAEGKSRNRRVELRKF